MGDERENSEGPGGGGERERAENKPFQKLITLLTYQRKQPTTLLSYRISTNVTR